MRSGAGCAGDPSVVPSAVSNRVEQMLVNSEASLQPRALALLAYNSNFDCLCDIRVELCGCAVDRLFNMLSNKLGFGVDVGFYRGRNLGRINGSSLAYRTTAYREDVKCEQVRVVMEENAAGDRSEHAATNEPQRVLHSRNRRI